MLKRTLTLQRVGKYGDKERRTEAARVDAFIREVGVQVWQEDRNQPVQLVEHQSQHVLLREEIRHVVPFYDFPHHCEGIALLLV